MATFEVQADERAMLSGELRFDTVGSLLEAGSRVIGEGRVAVIDLANVSAGDSAGLALLIEWLSVARNVDRPLRYENIPSQLQQLARLSEVEELLLGAGLVGRAPQGFGGSSAPGSTSGASSVSLPSETK
jgi:phospholipid transport system transporter-binding protein